MTNKIYENETFRAGDNYHLNACVGNNGFIGLHTYQWGYYEAVMDLIRSLKKSIDKSDLLIYPIVYSARHTIELFLKDQLYKLKYINSKARGTQFEAKIKNTHKISELWNEYKDLTSVDKRYEPYINELDEYIEDFCEVDDTGETFRYPFDHDEIRHLTELPRISVEIFEKRFEESYKIIDDLGYLTEFLVDEYREGTVVSGLSREQIKKIAMELPEKKDWINSNFQSIKEGIIQRHSISSSTLSKVLSFIQLHKEFAAIIGLEVPIKELSYAELKKYISLFKKFHRDLKSGDYLTIKSIFTDKICKSLTSDAIRSLSALFEISFFQLYSEAYERIIKEKADRDTFDLVYDDLLERKSTLKRIEKALETLGQKTLLQAFK